MSAHPSDANAPGPPAELYQALLAADPMARTCQILLIVEGRPDGRLDLPARDGVRAALDGIDLSPDHLRKQFDGAGDHPAWWIAERQAMDLRRANLRGASLRHANLQHALMEEADLAEADLVAANLQGVDLSGSDLQGTLLENADLRKAVLRFAKGRGSILEEAKLQGADLWGANMERADLNRADLQGATLQEANFQGANLEGADLRGAVLKKANLKGANLRGADLRGAALGGADLTGAVLRDAKIQEVDLTDCALAHIHTSGARMEKTLLDRDQLGGAIGEEVAREYGPARKGYLVLERNFNEMGDHDAEHWAYKRRRRMEKREARRLAWASWSEHRWGPAAHFTLKYVGDQFVEWVCDYGESIPRVLCALVAVYVSFVLVYGLTGTVLRVEQTPAGVVKAVTYNPADLALFSLASMTSPGNMPNYLLPRNAAAYLFSGLQTLLSIFLTGLMGFVAGNRIRR